MIYNNLSLHLLQEPKLKQTELCCSPRTLILCDVIRPSLFDCDTEENQEVSHWSSAGLFLNIRDNDVLLLFCLTRANVSSWIMRWINETTPTSLCDQHLQEPKQDSQTQTTVGLSTSCWLNWFNVASVFGGWMFQELQTLFLARWLCVSPERLSSSWTEGLYLSFSSSGFCSHKL